MIGKSVQEPLRKRRPGNAAAADRRRVLRRRPRTRSVCLMTTRLFGNALLYYIQGTTSPPRRFPKTAGNTSLIGCAKEEQFDF